MCVVQQSIQQAKINLPAGSYVYSPYVPFNVSAPTTTYMSLGRKQENHILMKFDRGKAFDEHLATDPRISESARMSGGAMFIFDDGGRYGAKIVRIVGVLVEYLKSENLMVATDIRVALDLIREQERRHAPV